MVTGDGRGQLEVSEGTQRAGKTQGDGEGVESGLWHQLMYHNIRRARFTICVTRVGVGWFASNADASP
jgi:hypothetical protein